MELLPIMELDRGGMGTVSVAARLEGGFQRYYAIKRLLEELRADPMQRSMFLEEARIAGSLHHPNVVPVLDVGEDAGGPFLVMEYVDGVSLGTLLAALRRAGRQLSIGQVLLLARDVTRGLGAAHAAVGSDGRPLAIVHRDISPQNVLLDFTGRARVTDFGIARAAGRDQKTRTGILKGKLGYMSPEQLRFRPIDQRSDLFALGVLVYEMASGIRLYPPGDDGMEGARRILEEPPPDLGADRDDAPPGLVRLTLDLLMKEPAARTPTAMDVEGELSALLEDCEEAAETLALQRLLVALFGDARSERSQTLAAAVDRAREAAHLPSAPPPAEPPRRRWAAIAAGVTLLGAIAGVGAVVALTDDPAAAPPAAQEPAAPAPTAAPAGPVELLPVPLAVEAHALEEPADAPEPPPAADGARSPSPMRRPAARQRRDPSPPAGPTPPPSEPSPRGGGFGTWGWEEN